MRPGSAHEKVARFLADPGHGMRVWERRGQPVSMAKASVRTPNAERISEVYTPPSHRRNGYAGALVAALTAERLDAGTAMVHLYTDLANPTSNHIYTRIGYEPIAEAAVYRLG